MVAKLLLLLVALGLSSKSDAGSLTLTTLTTHAVLGQPFRFRCDTMGPWDSTTGGVVLFKLGVWSKCVVSRESCQPSSSPLPGYSCACKGGTDDPVSYFLNITELNNTTLGPWVCEYQKKSNKIWLNTTEPTGPDSISATPDSPVVVRKSDNTILTCAAECVPRCALSWSLNSTTSEVKDTGNGRLVLTSVTPDKGGNYTCLAVNPASRKSASVTVEVIVHSPPRLDAGPSFSDKVLTTVGSKAILTVAFRAFPAPVFTWRKVEGGMLTLVQPREIQDSNPDQTGETDLFSSTLSLSVRESDLGVYSVTARNDVGDLTVYIQLLQEEMPKALATELQQKLPSFELGLGVGVVGTCLIAAFLGVLGYLKHRQIRKDLENPYASTDKIHLENHTQLAKESHYQELPTPKIHRKLDITMGPEDCDSMDLTKKVDDVDMAPIYDVVKEKEMDITGGRCVSVVVGQSLVNPMYGKHVIVGGGRP